MNSKFQETVDVGTWKQKFQELMQEVKPRARWTLKLDETLQPDRVAQGWKQYQQTAFGRFQCSSCKRRWGSAQVKILCHMYLELRKSQGQVHMRLFGQRCKKCSKSSFEKPEFSSESTMRILKNLVRRIQERYYGDGVKKFPEIPVIPEMPLDGSHDTANCEACSLGFCLWGLQNCITQLSNSPVPYMEFGNSLLHTDDTWGQNQAKNQSTAAKEAQGSGYSCEHKRSRSSHVTAGTQVPVAGPQPKRETDQQAAHRTGSQSFQVAGSLSPGKTDLQSSRAKVPLPSGWADLHSTLETGPQTSQKTYCQVLGLAKQQLKPVTGSKAAQGAGLQVKKGTDPQPIWRAGPTATHESGTFSGTQAAERRQERERYLPRQPPPHCFPSTNAPGPDNIFILGFACVAILASFVISKFF